MFLGDFLDITRCADSLLDFELSNLWYCQEVSFPYALEKYDFMRFASTLWGNSRYKSANDIKVEEAQIEAFQYFHVVKPLVMKFYNQETNPHLKKCLESFVNFAETNGYKDEFEEGSNRGWPYYDIE